MVKKAKPETALVKYTRIPELKSYLVERYRADTERIKENPSDKRTSHILIGPPGVGKTLACYEAGQAVAKETGRTFIEYFETVFFDLWSNKLTAEGQAVINDPEKYFVYQTYPLNLAEPTDLTGNPKEVPELTVTRYLPQFWVKLSNICPGFTVLDDFLDTQREDTLSAGYRVALDKVFGFVPVHRDRVIIATANTPEFSSLSRSMPVPLATRWEVHSVAPPTVDEWNAWMQETYHGKYDLTAYGFLKATEDEGNLLKLPDEPETTKAYPCPRSWKELARTLYFGPVDVEGTIGPEVGQKYMSFRAIKVDVDQLMRDPTQWAPLEYDSKYMVCILLSSWISQHGDTDYPQSFPLIDAMTDSSKEFFAVACQTMRSSSLTRYLMGLKSYNKKYAKLALDILKNRYEVVKARKEAGDA
jgi:hypothetical protein